MTSSNLISYTCILLFIINRNSKICHFPSIRPDHGQCSAVRKFTRFDRPQTDDTDRKRHPRKTICNLIPKYIFVIQIRKGKNLWRKETQNTSSYVTFGSYIFFLTDNYGFVVLLSFFFPRHLF